jgi:hypothetical protein
MAWTEKELTGDDLATYVAGRFPRKPEPVEMTDNARRRSGMNQAKMNPETGLVFRPVGRNVRVGNWSLVDVRHDAYDERRIVHHGTHMGSFVRKHDECTWENGDEDPVGPWEFVPVSTGWGSASDQQGMNRILSGTGWKYRRNGGRPRYEHVNGVTFPISQETR